MSDKEKLISRVLKAKTLAIIGLEKNTGKTETLNFIINNIKNLRTLGLTSIGTDGEEKDIVFGTLKPSVFVDYGTVFTTTELFFKKRLILSEIIYVSQQSTPTGRLIIAKALENGKVVLSGPPSADWMREVVNKLHDYAELVIVDGALSRFSQANPSIADSIILATGAAYSLDKREIVKHTYYVYNLCNLPKVDEETIKFLSQKNVLCVSQNNSWKETELKSLLEFQKFKENEILKSNYEKIFIPGALTDNSLRYLQNKEIIVRDFTKIFISYDNYLRFKPKIKVLEKSNLIGITVNPFSPTGYTLDSNEIISELKKHIPHMPIIDVRL